jgi:hypothetical protein
MPKPRRVGRRTLPIERSPCVVHTPESSGMVHQLDFREAQNTDPVAQGSHPMAKPTVCSTAAGIARLSGAHALQLWRLFAARRFMIAAIESGAPYASFG